MSSTSQKSGSSLPISVLGLTTFLLASFAVFHHTSVDSNPLATEFVSKIERLSARKKGFVSTKIAFGAKAESQALSLHRPPMFSFFCEEVEGF